ncbi:hypothetical protein CI610_01440 [invertebrate metagenome]|uniref:Uncharacterized protein n=1 Tax=invertebrate metagenome TaxID=1711999 RepID=A0A2H9T8K0_9ZZZZ
MLNTLNEPALSPFVISNMYQLMTYLNGLAHRERAWELTGNLLDFVMDTEMYPPPMYEFPTDNSLPEMEPESLPAFGKIKEAKTKEKFLYYLTEHYVPLNIRLCLLEHTRGKANPIINKPFWNSPPKGVTDAQIIEYMSRKIDKNKRFFLRVLGASDQDIILYDRKFPKPEETRKYITYAMRHIREGYESCTPGYFRQQVIRACKDVSIERFDLANNIERNEFD